MLKWNGLTAADNIMSENNVDTQIGRKLRALRNMKGMSQSTLAQESGITFQQVQKYEKGVNRIAASRLFDFSRILGVTTDYFYKDIDSKGAKVKEYSFGENENVAFAKPDLLDSKETLTLVREYYKIKEPSKRKHILEIIKAMNSER